MRARDIRCAEQLCEDNFMRTIQREFFIDSLLVRIFIIVMIRWTGLTPWDFEFPFPGSLASIFLKNHPHNAQRSVCGQLEARKVRI